jgi:hypothetical protein
MYSITVTECRQSAVTYGLTADGGTENGELLLFGGGLGGGCLLFGVKNCVSLGNEGEMKGRQMDIGCIGKALTECYWKTENATFC